MTIEFYEGLNEGREDTLRLLVTSSTSKDGEVAVELIRSRDALNHNAVAQRITVGVPPQKRDGLMGSLGALTAFKWQLKQEQERHIVVVAFPTVSWERIYRFCRKSERDLSREINKAKRAMWLEKSKSPPTFGDNKARIRKLGEK